MKHNMFCKRYILNSQNIFKRKETDNVSWWLSSSWRCSRRPRWPTSSSTPWTAARTLNLASAGDGEIELYNLDNESKLHKRLSKSLNLTSTNTNIEQHCGGQGRVVGVGAAQAVGPADGGGGYQGVCQEGDGQGDGHGVVEAGGGDGVPQHCDGEE